MALQTRSAGAPHWKPSPAPLKKPLIDGRRFDVMYFVAATWFVGGTILDSWAHSNIPRLETFWTPWHAVLYSGAFVVLLTLVGVTFLNRRRGAATWLEAIPRGYGVSMVGVFGMMLAGGGDAIWHTLFGVEQNVDAIFSPTHMLAMICAILIAVGPLCALYRRPEPVTFGDHLRLVYAFTLLLTMFSVFTQPTSPFILFRPPLDAGPGQDDEQMLAIISYIFQTMLITGCVLYVVRRWKLRSGFFTFALTVVSIPLAFMQGFFLAIPISLIAGLIVDMAYRWLQPSLEAHPFQFRLFAAIAAAAIPLVFIIALQIGYGPLAWTIHMTAGSILVTGILGWLLSYLMLPGQNTLPPNN
jgi:hypothetical protein